MMKISPEIQNPAYKPFIHGKPGGFPLFLLFAKKAGDVFSGSCVLVFWLGEEVLWYFSVVELFGEIRTNER